MGLLSFFKSSDDEPFPSDAVTSLEIDLVSFRVGTSILGQTPAESDFFTPHLLSAGVLEDVRTGIELGAKDGALEYANLNLGKFPGRFLFEGIPLNIGPATTETEIRQKFGEPYWADRDDAELILFYEYAGGSVELQFEFPDAGNLNVITLTREGVLADAEQRKIYRVDKPWPPN